MRKQLHLIRFILLMFAVVWCIPSWAQMSEGGIPPSFGLPTLRQSVQPYEAAINFNVNELKAEDAKNEAEGAPIRAAIIIPSDLSIGKDGRWIDLADGQRIWQLEISAPGATALMLYYDEFYIPKGGKLFIYNEKKNHILGAYTEKTNIRGEKFATEFVAGDKLILEYVTPKPEYTIIDDNGVARPGNLGDSPRIKISDIAYGYNHLEVYYIKNADPLSPKLRVGESESCMININCEEGNNWQTQKRGVAKSVTRIGTGSYLCSGTILNNTAQDLDPYFLTASHCFYNSSNPPTEKSAYFSQVIYYFNYESLNCQTTYPIQPKTMVGAELLVELPVIGGVAGTGGTDGALLKLLDPIPSDYNVYYNGWDKRNIAPTSGVGIHHPAGDIKKISTYTTTPTQTTWSGGPTNQWWNVKWATTVNGKSLTEGGSSGSPLFNQDGRVVGSLTGGPTQTGVPKCQQPVANHVAYYGKLSYHWDGANTGTGITDQTKKMKDYLDPINSGVDVLDGTYTGLTEPVAFFTADQTSLWPLGSVNYRDASSGASTWEWTFGGGTPATYNGQTPPSITYNGPGTFTTTLTINKGTANEKVKTMTITVSERGTNPVAPVAKFSLDGTLVMSEKFDAALVGWTTSNQGASANNWIRSNINNPIYQFNTVDPTNVASLLFPGDKNNLANNWMISPTYTVTSGSILEFWSLWLSNDPVSGILSVQVSTDNGTTWSEVWSNGPDNVYMNREWRKINVNLSDYASSTFKLAFKYEGKANDFALVDNLKIITPAALGTSKTIHVGETVTPIEWSAGPPVMFEWTFENGTPATSTAQYPGPIKYMQSGTFDITLKVKSNKGEDTYLFSDAVTVLDNLPVSAFSSESDGFILQTNGGAFLPLTGGEVQFAEKCTNFPTSWLWTLTGATPSSSTLQNISATYPSGENSYDVSLAATNGAGTATQAKTGYVKVGGKAEIWNVLYGETPNMRYTNSGYGITGGDLFTLTAERFETPATGEITKVRVYTQNVTRGSGNMLVAVYSDNGGLPGTQISATMTIPSASIAANGYNTITFTNPVGVSGTFHIVVGSSNYNTTYFTVPSVTQRSTTYNTVSAYYLGAWRAVNTLLPTMNVSMNIIPEFAYTQMSLTTPKFFKKKSIDATAETVNISTNATYWTASASDSWIHLSATSGTTSQLPFTFTCDDNTGNIRTGCITVKAGGLTKYIVIEQMGNTPVNLIAAINSTDQAVDLTWDHNIPVSPSPSPSLRSTLMSEMTSGTDGNAKVDLTLPETTTPQTKVNEWGFERLSSYNYLESIPQAELRSTSEAKLRWDNGTNVDAIGVASGANIEVAILFDQYDIYRYHVSKIKAVEIFPKNLGTNMVLKIRRGNTIIHTQPISGLTAGTFNRIELTNPIIVNASDSLTIGYSYTQAPGSQNFVPGCDAGPAKAGKGDLISLNGGPFISLANDAGISVNWNLSVVFETTTDVTYNVYRDNTLLASGLTTKSYKDLYAPGGNTCYKVSATYFNNSELETLKSNEACIVAPSAIIVQAIDASRYRFFNNPVFDFTVTGNLMGLHTMAEVRSWITGSSVADFYSPVGTYPIILSVNNTEPQYVFRIINGTLTVTRNPILPVIAEQPKGTTLCIGSDYTLSVRVPGEELTYQWYKGNNKVIGGTSSSLELKNVTLNDHEIYYVVVRNEGGTVTSEKASVYVAEPLSTISYKEFPDNAFIGSTYTLKLNGYPNVTKYTWSFSKNDVAKFAPVSGNENETKVTFNSAAIGIGTMKVDLEHTCGTYSLSRDINVKYPTGIDDVENSIVKIYPNPVSNVLNISYNQQSIKSVIVNDISGRRIERYDNVGSNQLSIPASRWTKGTYIVIIETDKGKTVQKVIKK